VLRTEHTPESKKTKADMKPKRTKLFNLTNHCKLALQFFDSDTIILATYYYYYYY